MPKKRLAIFLFCAFFLFGCAATSTVSVPAETAKGQASFNFLDLRPDREKRGEAEHPSNYQKIYSDEMINPKPQMLVKTSLQQKLNSQLIGKDVKLKSFIMSVMGANGYDAPGNVGLDGAIFAIVFAPIVIGTVVDAEIENSNSNQFINTNIEIEIDDKSYYGGATIEHKGRVGNSQLSKSMQQALDNLIENIKSRID